MWTSSPDVGEIISCCVLAGWGWGTIQENKHKIIHSDETLQKHTHLGVKTSPSEQDETTLQNKHISMILVFFLIFFLNRSLSYTYSTTCSWQIFTAHPYFPYICSGWYVCEVTVKSPLADLCGLNTRLLQRNTCTVKYIPLKGWRGVCTHTNKPPLSVCVCVLFF